MKYEVVFHRWIENSGWQYDCTMDILDEPCEADDYIEYENEETIAHGCDPTYHEDGMISITSVEDDGASFSSTAWVPEHWLNWTNEED